MRQQVIISDQEEEARRSGFRFYAVCSVSVISAITYSALTGHWSAIIGVLILFTIGISLGTFWGGMIMDGYPAIWLFIIFTASGAIVANDFSNTTITKWEERVGAVAMDGWISHSTGRGTASHHGGVAQWITVPHVRTLSSEERWDRVFNKLWYLLPVLASSACLIVERVFLGRNKQFTRPRESFEIKKPDNTIDTPVSRQKTIPEITTKVIDLKSGSLPSEPIPTAPLCPLCSHKMILRTAKRGKYMGSRFWGCSTWPRCKGTRKISTN